MTTPIPGSAGERPASKDEPSEAGAVAPPGNTAILADLVAAVKDLNTTIAGLQPAKKASQDIPLNAPSPQTLAPATEIAAATTDSGAIGETPSKPSARVNLADLVVAVKDLKTAVSELRPAKSELARAGAEAQRSEPAAVRLGSVWLAIAAMALVILCIAIWKGSPPSDLQELGQSTIQRLDEKLQKQAEATQKMVRDGQEVVQKKLDSTQTMWQKDREASQQMESLKTELQKLKQFAQQAANSLTDAKAALDPAIKSKELIDEIANDLRGKVTAASENLKKVKTNLERATTAAANASPAEVDTLKAAVDTAENEAASTKANADAVAPLAAEAAVVLSNIRQNVTKAATPTSTVQIAKVWDYATGSFVKGGGQEILQVKKPWQIEIDLEGVTDQSELNNAKFTLTLLSSDPPELDRNTQPRPFVPTPIAPNSFGPPQKAGTFQYVWAIPEEHEGTGFVAGQYLLAVDSSAKTTSTNLPNDNPKAALPSIRRATQINLRQTADPELREPVGVVSAPPGGVATIKAQNNPDAEQSEASTDVCCKDAIDEERKKCKLAECTYEFALAARFPRPGFDREFWHFDSDGAIVHENMQISWCTDDGSYEIQYCVSTPETVQLRLQLDFKKKHDDKSEPQTFTITLPTKTIPIGINPSRSEPTKVRSVRIQGKSPWLKGKGMDVFEDIRRRGTARFGSLPPAATFADPALRENNDATGTTSTQTGSESVAIEEPGNAGE